MSNTLLNDAVSKLGIIDLFLIECNTERKDQFIPPYIFDKEVVESEYKIQFFNTVKDFTTLKNDKGIEDQVLYKYNVGFRYVDKKDDKDIKIMFTAVFAAVYQISSDLSHEALLEFGKVNVGFNVWPYWRELASSVSNRFRIGNLTVPLYKMGCDS